MTAAPLLSIVVPTRDRPGQLARAVASALAQDYPRLEVVVVDDSSGPEIHRQVEKAVAVDDRVRILRTTVAHGASASRNLGIRAAQGELIAFLDDDDAWLPSTARTACDYLLDHPKVGGVSAWHEVYTGDGRSATYRGPTSYDASDLLWCNVLAAIFSVLRRDRFGEELAFDQGMVTAEDWDLYLRCARLHPLVTLPAVLYRLGRTGLPSLMSSRDRRLAGYRSFVAKHESEMTPLCRSYHRAREELMMAENPHEKLRVASRLLRSSPLSVSLLNLRESISARFGRFTSDPARSVRSLVSAAHGR